MTVQHVRIGMPCSDRTDTPVSRRGSAGTAAGWRYSDPAGGDHDVVNCSVSELELTIRTPGGAAPRKLHSSHGAAYELGMRERDHGVALAPFSDG